MKMTAMEKALKALESESFTEEKIFKAPTLYLVDAEAILEQFEIDLLKELEEEKLKQELC